MSSYRSYAPWKSSFSPSYKSGSSSAYSSRDDVSSTSRYGSLAGPSAYRPSFSGGTYRLKRDPTATPITTYVSRYGSSGSTSGVSLNKADKENSSDSSSKTGSQLKRYSTSASNLGKYAHSREPSPAAIERTNRLKSRDPSPVTRPLRGKSRDPSPGIDNKCKIGYGGVNSYRMSSQRSNGPASYSSKYMGNTNRPSLSVAPDKSISYLSASDFKARSISKAKENVTRKSKEKEIEAESSTKSSSSEKSSPLSDKDHFKMVSTKSENSVIDENSNEEAEDEEEAEETFVAVSVVTRATSPTPPGSTTVQRTRRIDIAKTIEKTIQRSTRKKESFEKEIQSDRLDDSTRYLRFGLSSRISSSYSPHSDRYTPSSLRYSASPLSSTSAKSSSTTSEPRKDESSSSSNKNSKGFSSKSKLSPPKVVRLNSRQSSTENLANKPPAPPKAESPTKSSSSSSQTNGTKWLNKDFRKSSLNVGPTDRPRKSRTPSTGNDSDAVVPTAQENIARLERSPSSENSINSGTQIKKSPTESKLKPRCHPKASSTSTSSSSIAQISLSRHNSSTNIKNSIQKTVNSTNAIATNSTKASGSSPSSTAATTSSTSATASSSSGAESSGENKKPLKRQIKKKSLNTHNKQIGNDNTGDANILQQQSNESIKSSSSSSVASSASKSKIKAKAKTTLKIDSENLSSSQQAFIIENTLATTDSPERHSSPTTKSIMPPQTSPSKLMKNNSETKANQRLQRLSSVSNFFLARQHEENSEPIYLESSESSGELDTQFSISNSLTIESKTSASPAHNDFNTTTSGAANNIEYPSTVSYDNDKTTLESQDELTTPSQTCSNETSADNREPSSESIKSNSSSCLNDTITLDTFSTTVHLPTEENLDSIFSTFATTTSTDQEEPSWWQNTSRQIDTESALDFNQKDDMHFRLRHIDSGEVAWWLGNDEDDTLADDDIKTLNQEDDEDDEGNASEATDEVHSLQTFSSSGAQGSKQHWWLDEQNDTNDFDVNPNKCNEVNSNKDEVDSNWSLKNLPRSNCSPVQHNWWSETNSNANSNSNENENASKENYQSSNYSKDEPLNGSPQKPLPNGSIHLKICRVESGDRPWWLEEEEKEDAKIQRNPAEEDVEEATDLQEKEEEEDLLSYGPSDGPKHWWMSGPTRKLFNVRRVESGEKAWWQQDEESEQRNTFPSNKKIDVHLNNNNCSGGEVKGDDDCIDQVYEAENLNNDNEIAQINQSFAKTENFGNGIDLQTEMSNSFNFKYSERPPPLGQCASPLPHDESAPIVTPRYHCKSPYDNIPQHSNTNQYNNNNKGSGNNYLYEMQQDHGKSQSPYDLENSFNSSNQQQWSYNNNSNKINSNGFYNNNNHQYSNDSENSNTISNTKSHQFQANGSGGKLFISRHQNIDELLGGSCRPLGSLFYDSNSFPTLSSGQNIFLEEITPDQVRIHDSTAQIPVIQRMERDEWAANSNGMPDYQNKTKIDDAAIQVYKDGDYGAYLDLESSLAEQSEEIEGLNSSRKNSLVVRTQLSVRVHAIIEKLLSAQGSDLRRALFSLKQVFQEDKDLVHAFVALGGLNCLVRVGNGADQNYQNYILRALGQVMLYVDGMNGVMKHEPTMQWLYSLISSNYRSVVKTALKLLLVFVEYAESNCYVLVNAIHAVDKAQGTLPWTNIMRLLKDYDNADAELVIYATSLINKTLAGLNDQDTFYDESDLLEQQGMETVIQRYMSKPGTDLDLLDQLQLYEEVLKFEDGESDGIRLPDNSIRKTQRYRLGTDTAERRKSRRHSTGTSPSTNNKVLTSKRCTPTHGVLDEDSSGSTNSAELGGGLFQNNTKIRDAGVTPGLRRRRERAERHKSFLKEQEEAAANGILAALEKREELDKGQILTAIPAKATINDSPPESLHLTNENIVIANLNVNKNNININNNNSNINNSNYTNTINNTTTTTTTTTSIINSANANTNHLNKNINQSQSQSQNINNNNNHSINNSTNNLLSPTKHLLSNNSISIINNSFEKNSFHHNNISQSPINKMQEVLPEFQTKKNLLSEKTSTVINGIMKNIQRNGGNDIENRYDLHNNINNINNNNNNINNINNSSYKKFENDANRLNTYYSQMSTPKSKPFSPQQTNQNSISNQIQNQNQNHYEPLSNIQQNSSMQQPPTPVLNHSAPLNHLNSPVSSPTYEQSQTPSIQTAQQVLAAVLSPTKTLNGFDFTQNSSTPLNNGYNHNNRNVFNNTIPPLCINSNSNSVKELLSPKEVKMDKPQFSLTASNVKQNSSDPLGQEQILDQHQHQLQYQPMDYQTNDIGSPQHLQKIVSPKVNVSPMMAPPPPPPPPPPPDLWGFPMKFAPVDSFTPSLTNRLQQKLSNIGLNTMEGIVTDTRAILNPEPESEDKKLLLQLQRDHTVKDLTQKLNNLPTSPTHEEKEQSRIVGDMSGLISKAKESLAKSKSKGEMSRSSSVDQEIKKVEPKKSENELHWEELVRNMSRPLNLCDLDFTDLTTDDEKDILAPRGLGAGVPPPPPMMLSGGAINNPPPMGNLLPPPMFSYSGYSNSSLTNSVNSSLNGSINGDLGSNTNTIKKNKKTVKLFWKEVREDLIPVTVGKTIWDELPQANVDTQKLEHLFESRAKDLMIKKQQEMNKTKEIIVLDHKRSNAINIAMTKLPPTRAIKAAILKMDGTVVTREGIDKLLNMLPTDEERGKIQEAQMANPELPLGSAEQFLLALSSISELGPRLKLWAFRLDFDNSEKEIAEPLMDLKQGIEILRKNRTFKCILSTLLSVGIFLNGSQVKGFQIEYLSKVPEVKDTVHKHSLLHHLCHMVMETCSETTDLYSEIGPITRASKADFADLAHNLNQLEAECKASWDRLKLIAKHDCSPQFNKKLFDFLADAAERIIILQIVHRRIMNRYRKFLLWLGVPQHSVAESKPNEFCSTVSEFALEYRTTRERVQQQLEKKANHRERNKTRGKLIIDMAKFKTKEDRADAELKELLGTPNTDTADGTLTWRRRKAEQLRSPISRQSEENFTDGDDEILESLVKTATKAPGTRTTPRERKRTRHTDRKSLKRSRTREGFTVERAPSQ